MAECLNAAAFLKLFVSSDETLPRLLMGTERVESSSALRLTSTGEGQSVVVGVWYRKERPKKPGLNFAMPKSHYNEFEVDQMLVLHQPVDWPHSSDYKDELTDRDMEVHSS